MDFRDMPKQCYDVISFHDCKCDNVADDDIVLVIWHLRSTDIGSSQFTSSPICKFFNYQKNLKYER